MPVSTSWKGFSEEARQLGSELVRREAVRVLAHRTGKFEVSVADGLGQLVTLSWSGDAPTSVTAACTCQGAEALCPHVWAVAESRREHLAAYGILPETTAIVVSQGPTSWVDQYALAERTRTYETHAADDWATRIERVQQQARLHRDHHGNRVNRSGKSLLRFLMNVSESLRAGKLVIQLRVDTQEPDAANRPSKILHDPGAAYDYATNAESIFLDALFEQQELSWDRGLRNKQILDPYFFPMLRKIADNGQLLWHLGDDDPVERPVAWCDRPHRFEIQLEPEPADDAWTVDGMLTDGTRRHPLTSPVLLLSSGLVLFPNMLAPLETAGDFSWIVQLRRQGPIRVPAEGRAALISSLIESGIEHEQLPENLRWQTVAGVPEPRMELRQVRHSSHMMDVEISFQYGDHNVANHDPAEGIVDPDGNRYVARDFDGEARHLACAESHGVIRHSKDHLEVSARRLPELVPALVQQGWVIEAEGKRYRAHGSVSFSVTSEVDWFEVHGHAQFDGETVALPRLLAAVRSGQRWVQLGDGSMGMLPDDWLAQMGALSDMATVATDEDGEHVRFTRAQSLLLDSLLAAQDASQVQVDRTFTRLNDRLRTIKGVKPRNAPRGFQGTLREYQRDGVGWLHFLRNFGFGGCLADDMGLGKTVQVLALLESRRQRKLPEGQPRQPSLVVVPRSLVFNWVAEAERFAPRLKVLNYTGLQRDMLRPQIADHDVVVTTYGTLRRDIEHLLDVPFDYAILDESQAIKNPASQASKVCRLLKADHRLAMTGTPIENHIGELWALFEFLNPGMLGRASGFRKQFDAKTSEPQRREALAAALRPFILRRTKDQVLDDLPPKNEQTIFCEMGKQQQALYDELRDFYRASLTKRVKKTGMQKSKMHVLEALLRLRQAACHPQLLDRKNTAHSAKLDMLMEHLREVTAEGHKALVFSQFTSLLEIVRRQVEQEKMTFEYLDGRTRRRDLKVNRFQTDPDCSLFLISLKAGGHGLNLTAADYVFILDPWWNPAVEAQAVDRAHRIGQQRPVFAYRLICKGTVEEKILQLQTDKREIAEAIINQKNSLLRQLSFEDLEGLLS